MSAANGRPKKPRTGPRAVTASPAARRTGALILEAIAGLRTTQEAADALGVAMPRYYVLETRALEGFLQALEPRRRGRKRSDDQKIAALEADVKRLEREVRRYQALQRASQRALGVPATAGTPARRKKSAKAGKTRKRHRASRAERILARLDAPPDAPPPETSPSGGDS